MSYMVIGSKEENLVREITNFTERYCGMLEILFDFEDMVLDSLNRPSRKLNKIFSRIRELHDLISSFKIKYALDYDDPSSIKSHYIELVWKGKKYSTKGKDSHLNKRELVTYTVEFANAIIEKVDEISSENIFVMTRITEMKKDFDNIINEYLS